jgi:hypothetical protein
METRNQPESWRPSPTRHATDKQILIFLSVGELTPFYVFAYQSKKRPSPLTVEAGHPAYHAEAPLWTQSAKKGPVTLMSPAHRPGVASSKSGGRASRGEQTLGHRSLTCSRRGTNSAGRCKLVETSSRQMPDGNLEASCRGATSTDRRTSCWLSSEGRKPAYGSVIRK